MKGNSTVNYPNQPAGYPPYPPQNQQPQGAPGFGYAPQQQPPPGYYNPQQYPPPWQPAGAPAQQPPVLARGTLEDWVDQPTGGGGAATSKFFTPARMNGHWLRVRVTRDLNNSDVRQQTDKFGTPLTFKSNGKPKFQLLLPCQVLDSSDPGAVQQVFTDGNVTVYLKGVPSDSFKAAMSAAGITDPTRALNNGFLGGAEFYMVGAGTKQFGSGNAANMFDFTYTPNGREMNAAQGDPTQGAQTVAATPAPASAPPQQYAPAPSAAPPAPVPPGYQAATPAYAPPSAPPSADPNLAYYQATGQLPPTPPPFAPTGAPPAPPTGAAIPSAVPPAPPQGYAPVPPPPPSGVPQGFQPPPVPPAPGAPPAPPAGYAPQGVQMDPEKAALLQRLQGQG